MKNQPLLLILAISLISISVNAQSIDTHNETKISTNLRFDYTPSIDNTFNLKLLKTTKRNSLLFSTGYLLQGLKYISPIDQFNATAPFDIRGYNPKDFSSYVSYINDTSLLQQSITPIK